MRGELTPAWDSGNTTFWEEYSDIAFVVANSLILLITCAVGIGANLFVILAVYQQKSLQNVNNALVVNLAVIDLLRCLIDCPILLTIVITVNHRGHVHELICDTQVTFFSFSCCIQLLTLASISAERYQAIARPFTTTQRRRRIMVLIPLMWTLAILVAAFCLILMKDSPVHERCTGLSMETSSSYDTFGLYMLFPLWAVCISVIIGFYTSIFLLVRTHNRKIFDKGSFPLSKKDKTEDEQKKEETTAVENGHGKSEQNLSKSVAGGKLPAEQNVSNKDSADAILASTKAPQCASLGSEIKKELKNTLVISDLETETLHPPALQVAEQSETKPFKAEQPNPCGTEFEVKLSNGDAAASVKSSTTKPQKVSSNFNTEKPSKERVNIDEVPSEMKEASPHVHSSAQLENPEPTSVLLIEPKQDKSNNGGETLNVSTADQGSSLPPGSSNVPEAEATKQDVEGAVCMMPSKASRERASKKKESKMAKRAGYIIVTFLLFWLPLIITILINCVVHGNKTPQVKVIKEVEILSVSVTCITSLSNPIIYAAVNPQFRTEFYRLKTKCVSRFTKK
ncbi:hypothetical protein JOQ06_002119 [Pogonophryne albipinna]|uniref:G-protein coupled receptors family 1 profile domain-containing protein n=1 Tax=Pogonophryne albipinna TaxID=1090488 RepID=A0AAD6FKZ4_9TELE|nr:hypothetical protein JOQ06_002119 [Pogonophryne albipinna]